MFSSRVPSELEPNAISRACERARAEGRELIDLTLSNPTRAGIVCDPAVLQALAAPEGVAYCPEPFGLMPARAAVAADYSRRGLDISPRCIALTASTSEAYALLFKLLCDPGDDVLVPVPSYPLFDHLARLEAIRCRPYRLEHDVRWHLDPRGLDDAWSPRTRAVLSVSPNNPTGSVLTAGELSAMSERCAARSAALVLDEVFADYRLTSGGAVANALAPGSRCLSFRLGGLSKSAGLPQLKLGWIAVEGPAPLVGQALARLELICDTYLSVSTAVQLAAPALIAGGATMRAQILARVQRNASALRRAVKEHPAVSLLESEAGWTSVLRVPSRGSEEDLVLGLLEEKRILVHPGFFFDFPYESFVIVSLLPPPAIFDEGAARLLEYMDA